MSLLGDGQLYLPLTFSQSLGFIDLRQPFYAAFLGWNRLRQYSVSGYAKSF